MSAIAEILISNGVQVQGSDMNDNANVKRLRKLGAEIFIGHDAKNLPSEGAIVFSTAVKAENAEYKAAKERGMVLLSRADILAQIMGEKRAISITGTHGKTTTTSLTAMVLEAGGLDPTVINGGILAAWGSNARAGKTPLMVVEADESDGTFIKLPSEIGVVTNIDPEHLDYYGSVEKMEAAFCRFFEQIPSHGLLVLGIDHPVVRKMIEACPEIRQAKKVLTYGFSQDADLRLLDVRSEGPRCSFDVALGENVAGGRAELRDVKLAVPGEYNAQNALAAMAVALEQGVEIEVIRAALGGFAGVGRRFTPAGQWGQVDFYDDYAHHPVEIASVLKAARGAAQNRVIAIMQPHRYSRLHDLFDDFCACFDDADIAVITPIFAAGEKPIEGVSQDALIAGIKAHKAKGNERHEEAMRENVLALAGPEDLPELISSIAQPGDLVIALGAGTISYIINQLPGQLSALSSQSAPMQATAPKGAFASAPEPQDIGKPAGEPA